MTAYLLFFCRFLVGGVFLVSAVAKLRDVGGFRSALRGYRLLPARAEWPTAVVVIAAELAVPLLLIPPGTVLIGFSLAALLLAGFVVALVSVLRRGLVTSCGCAGRSSSPVRWAHVWRNVALIAVGLTGAVVAAGAGAGPAVELAVVLVVAVAAACVVAVLAFFDDLLALFAP